MRKVNKCEKKIAIIIAKFVIMREIRKIINAKNFSLFLHLVRNQCKKFLTFLAFLAFIAIFLHLSFYARNILDLQKM